jgi:hypothetical protein
MGRPPCDVEDYREWQKRLERFGSSELDRDTFCLQEGVSRSTLYRWQQRLKDGIPESIESDAVEVDAANSNGAAFLPVSLKAPRIEIELPNGGVLRLPHDIGQNALVAIVKVVGSLRPWKAPQS